MRAKACASRWRAASATTTATTPPGATSRTPSSTWCCSSATTSTSTPRRRRRCAATRAWRCARWTHYRARYAQYKSDPLLQAAHAALPWLTVWDDHEVDNDYAASQGQALQTDFAAQRAAAYRAYWEHMPFPKAWKPTGADMRIYGRTDWGALACIHALDDRQYRDPQACPREGRGGSNSVRLRDCPELTDPKRSLLGAAQERWLAEGWDAAAPLEPGGAADLDDATGLEQRQRTGRTGPTAGMATPRRASACWPRWPSARCRAWWCSAATCTRTTWPT